MATTIQVGVLRAQLTADTAKFTAGFREADATVKKFTANSKAASASLVSANKKASDAMIASMSAAGKANSASAKMIAGMSQAGREAAAAQAAAAQAALGYTGRLKTLGTEALASAKSSGLLNNSIGKLAIGLGSLAIIGKVVGWLGGMAVGAVDAAGNLVDLNEKTGLSIKALQQMQSVAEQTGSTLESFSNAAIKLGVRVEAGSKPVKQAVEDLGLSLKTLQAQKPEDQFRAIADALGRIEDPQKRNELALRLFGKSFADVMPAIVEGYGKLADAAKVAGDAQVKALDAAGDAWTRFKNNASKATIDFLGNLALIAEGAKALSFPDKLRLAVQASLHGADLLSILNLLRDVGAASATAGEQTKKFIGPLMTSAKAQETYSQQLAKVRAELAALTPEQRKEIAAAQALGVSTDDLETKFGLTDGALRILNTSIDQSSKSQKEAGQIVRELAEGYAIWQKAVQDVTHDIHALAVANAGAMADAGAKKAERRSDADLRSFNSRTEAQRDAADTSNDIEEQRAEFAIEQAKRAGASWQQIYAMEKDLADARLQHAIDQAETEFKIRTLWIDRTSKFGEEEYQALKHAHDLAVQEMVERHQQAEVSKRQEVAKTHNFWLQQMRIVKDGLNRLADQSTGTLATLLFGEPSDPETKKREQEAITTAREAYQKLKTEADKSAGAVQKAHDKMIASQKAFDDAKARKAPAEELQRLSALAVQSRMTYERIAKDGKDSAEDIQDAYDRMREAEEAANHGFASRWREFWSGLKHTFMDILNDMLGSFVRQFIGGMINALTKGQGGFKGAMSNFLGGGGGLLGIASGGGGGDLPGMGGGGGLLGKIPGPIGRFFGGGAAASSGLFASGGASAGLASGEAINATTAGLASGSGGAGGAGGLGFLSNPAFWTNPWTIGIAGAITLGAFIWKKGLFRGGWEAVEGNKRRDQFQAQFGGPGHGPDSGFHKIAAFLTSKTGESGGGRIFRDLQSGDKKRFESAEQTIAAMWNQANKGKQVQTFLFGGLVKGLGAIPAVLHGGEGVLSAAGMRNIGGAMGLRAINSGVAKKRTSIADAITGRSASDLASADLPMSIVDALKAAGQAQPSPTIINIAMHVQAWDHIDAARWIRTVGIQEIKQAITLNTGGLGVAVRGAT